MHNYCELKKFYWNANIKMDILIKEINKSDVWNVVKNYKKLKLRKRMKEDSRLWQQLEETDRKREKGLCRISSMRQLN